jgi:hypothetical protein
MKSNHITNRELALGGIFGSAGLLLTVVFHILHLGQIFMPMYLPLVALGFMVSPPIAAGTSFLVPLISGALTGMPPFFPPISPVMSIELAVMGTLIAVLRQKWPDGYEYLILIPVLLLGRVMNFTLVYIISRSMELPAGFLAGASFLAGWPGLLLIIAVVPSLVRTLRRMKRNQTQFEASSEQLH